MKLVNITEKVETLPKNWASDLINKIIWGDNEHFYEKPKVEEVINQE